MLALYVCVRATASPGRTHGRDGLTQRIFSLDSSDDSGRSAAQVAAIPVPVRRSAPAPADAAPLLSKLRRAGHVPLPVQRLKLPPPGGDLSAYL